jgi:hypothetical protein
MKGLQLTLAMAAGLLMGSLASCSEHPAKAKGTKDVEATGSGYTGAPFSVKRIEMPNGVKCYVATETGHSIAIHCFHVGDDPA